MSDNENEKRETVADIVAEMFDFADKRIEEGRDHAMTSESVGLIVHQLAKRFEAAWKREPVGNAAAMREALVEAIGETCAGCKRDCDDCMNLKSGWMKKAKAALSAPARNCDRYNDAPSAYADFIVPWKLDGHLDDVPTLQDFTNWLFAPAERKGATA